MKFVIWIAWKSDGRGFVFRAPDNLSKADANSYAERIFQTLFVSVQQL